MSNDLHEYRDRVSVADGAWGSLFLQRGARQGELVERWNTSAPDTVRAVAEAYVEAGADIILTNTFRANRFTLDSHAAAGQVAQINEAGARLSKQAAGTRARVFGSIGPSGRMLLTDEVTVDVLREAFGEQASALAAGGADAIVCETFSALDEAVIAVRAAKDATALPVVACMTFDSGPDMTHTMMGVSPEQAVPALTDAGADAVGCNCGVGIDEAVPIVRTMRWHTDRPIWAKPNAGLPVLEDGNTVYSETPVRFASKVPMLIEAGANIVGGCCGTTPAFIRAVVQTVRK